MLSSASRVPCIFECCSLNLLEALILDVSVLLEQVNLDLTYSKFTSSSCSISYRRTRTSSCVSLPKAFCSLTSRPFSALLPCTRPTSTGPLLSNNLLIGCASSSATREIYVLQVCYIEIGNYNTVIIVRVIIMQLCRSRYSSIGMTSKMTRTACQSTVIGCELI